MAGCSNLDRLTAGQCGNFVVDPGEDCDTFPATRTDSGPWCRPAGSVGQCRYDCSSSPAQCKPGWGCGSDGICRAPSGHFDEKKLSSTDSFALELGDFDGNGRSDLLSAEESSITLRTFDDSGGATETFSAALQVDSVAHGRLTSGDAVDDVLMSYRGRVLALQGSADGNPEPIAMDSRSVMSTPSSAARLFVADVASAPRRFGIVDSSLYSWDPRAFKSCSVVGDNALFALDFTVEMADPGVASATVLASGHFDVSSDSATDCDELVASQANADRVWVYGLCAKADSTACNRDPARYAAVSLSAGWSVLSGPFVARVNADAMPDLVVLEQQNNVRQLVVAYGVGDGSFHSSAASLPAKDGDGAFSVLIAEPPSGGPGSQQGPGGGGISNSTLLQAADLDGDDLADFVFSSVLALSSRPSAPSAPCSTGSAYACENLVGGRWNSAATGDFNGDGLLDIAGWRAAQNAGPSAESALDLLVNAGHGTFNQFVVGTAGPVEQLSPLLGDFDGDLFPDLALAVQVSGATEIQLLFGAPSKPLTESAELAGIGTLVDQAAGALSDDGDAETDMFLLTERTALELTTFSGDSSRVPISGLSLSASGAAQPDYEARVVRAGHFGNQDQEDIAVVSMHENAMPGAGSPDQQQGHAFVHLVRLDPSGRPLAPDTLRDAADTLAVELGSSSLVSGVTGGFVGVADVDSGGNDELVFIGSGSSGGTSLVQTWTPNGDRFALGNEFSVSATLAVSGRSRPGDLQLQPALVADVDADGTADVTAVTSDGVIVLRGAAGEDLSEARVTHLSLPDLHLSTPAVFAWANLDSDATLELVRATSAGLERFDVTSWDPEVAPEARAITSAAGMGFSSTSAPGALTAGDVTGDGIDDLVLDASGLWLLRGQAVLR